MFMIFVSLLASFPPKDATDNAATEINFRQLLLLPLPLPLPPLQQTVNSCHPEAVSSQTCVQVRERERERVRE